MSLRAQITLGAVLLASALGAALPSAASAHAYLVRTSPAASRVLNAAPSTVALTFDEAVEPRFALISVSNAQGTNQTSSVVTRSRTNPDTLVVALRPGLSQGWYLVYWRAISVDGHPVQGAFTYAVGPNPGPSPQFPIPHLSATAVTPQLLVARWMMFLSVMTAIGLLALRLTMARTILRRAPAFSLRALNSACLLTGVIGLLAIPVYLDFAVANDSLRSVLDLGALLPLYRATAFGRGYVDLELCFALFCLAGGVALWVDRPERPRRSLAELAAAAGATVGASAVLIVPAAVGHAGQTSPRGLSVALDAVHLLSGSIWIGGLVGLLLLWLALDPEQRVSVLAVVVPRFSVVAFISVVLLLATGTGSTIVHMPAISALWDTGYGVAILVKIGLLTLAVALASGNLLRSRPRLVAASRGPDSGRGAARLLARLVSGEAILVTGAVFTAAILSSLAPPPPAFALENSALAHVGPGRVAETVRRAGYRLQVLVSPNKAAAPDSFALRVTRRGVPVRGATVTLTFNHLQMEMPQQVYALSEVSPGVYKRDASALIMVGPWSLAFSVAARGAPPFTALIVDQANG